MSAIAADGVWKYFGDYPALRGASLQHLNRGERLLHLALHAHDADVVLHRFLQGFLDLIRPLGRI